MQRQKTIAKWLAIILLLTVIVACYIALSAVLNNKKTDSDIAGAGDSTGGDQTVTPPVKDDDPEPPPQLTFTTFPRAAETVDGVTVRHVGGDGNDLYEGSVYYGGKRLVFFKSGSIQYDVDGAGLYAAVFDGDMLLETVKLAEADERFVASSIVKNGLLVVTKNDSQTVLRLLDLKCRVIAHNTCPAYSSYKLALFGSTARMFVSDGKNLCALTITTALDVIRSNYVYPIENCNILDALSFAGFETVLTQTEQGIGILIFDALKGFTYKNEMLKCSFLQVMPILSNDKPALIIVSSSPDGAFIASIASDFSTAETFLIEGASSAVAMRKENNNIAVITNDKLYTFCSHLELQSTVNLQISDDIYPALNAVLQEDISAVGLTAVGGSDSLYFMSLGNAFCLAELDGQNVKLRFAAKGDLPAFVKGPAEGATVKISLIFTASAENAFGYMCFGENDVFYVTL